METSTSWFQLSKCGLTLQPLVRGVCVMEEAGRVQSWIVHLKIFSLLPFMLVVLLPFPVSVLSVVESVLRMKSFLK